MDFLQDGFIWGGAWPKKAVSAARCGENFVTPRGGVCCAVFAHKSFFAHKKGKSAAGNELPFLMASFGGNKAAGAAALRGDNDPRSRPIPSQSKDTSVGTAL